MTLGQLWIFLGPRDDFLVTIVGACLCPVGSQHMVICIQDCMFSIVFMGQRRARLKTWGGSFDMDKCCRLGSLMLSFWVIWWLLASRPQASINMRPRWPLTCRATQLFKYMAIQWSTTACTCTVEYCGIPYSTLNYSGILSNTLNYLGVPRITLEYLELPSNTVEYIGVPRTTLEYLKLL